MGTVMMERTRLVRREPFMGLFPIDEDLVKTLASNMRREGFRPEAPIRVWTDAEGAVVVLDGHTRIEAAALAGIAEIAVAQVEDLTDDREALEWAMREQRDRRNLTGENLRKFHVAAVLRLDELRQRGGDRRSEEAKADQKLAGKLLKSSAEETAAKVGGIGASTVEDIRGAMKHGDEKLKASLEAGKIAAKTAAKIARAGRATAKKAERAQPTKRGGKGGKACRICGGTEWWPHKRGGRDCKQCVMRRAAEGAQRKLELADAAYAHVLTTRLPEPERTRLLHRIHREGLEKVPPIAPSRLFPGLKPSLDERLIREGKARDVACLTALAAVKPDEQREFYERYTRDPAEAQRWVELPRWKRPLLAGDPQDRVIWRFFTIKRLQMELTATDRIWPLPGQGASLMVEAGLLESITERSRLAAVLSAYGGMLFRGEALGDQTHPPWFVSAIRRGADEPAAPQEEAPEGPPPPEAPPQDDGTEEGPR